MSEQKAPASIGIVDDSPLQGLEFFQDRPHFAVHKETAIVNAEREMSEEAAAEAAAEALKKQ